jgi:hypothetical protein
MLGLSGELSTNELRSNKEIAMKSRSMRLFYSLSALAAMALAIPPAHAKGGPADDAVPVTMTVTATVANGKRLPDITRDDVVVKRGNQRLRVTNWTPAQGNRAGLDLFILIDDAADPILGSQLGDLRQFINSQPPTTAVGIGYMSNARVRVVQNLTTDHAQAANALRMPIGSAGAYGSPYLSVSNLMKQWPNSQNRREVVMVTDGIDRARRHVSPRRGLETNPDVDSAAYVAQKTGTVIHTIYTPGAGRIHRTYWQGTNGQMEMARLSAKTGGRSFYLGLQNPVSFQPYLDQLQRVLDNQYLLSFNAAPAKQPGLQYVKLSTELAGVDLTTHDAVWVPSSR